MNRKILARRLQVRQMYSSANGSIIAGLLLATLVIFLERNAVSSKDIFYWYSLIVMVSVTRLGLVLAYRRAEIINASNVRTWLIRFRVGVLLSGVIWGLSSIFIMPMNDLPHMLFLIFVVAGVTAGAVVSYSADVVSTVLFSVPIILPIVIRLMEKGDELAVAMGIALIMYLGFIIVNVMNTNRHIIENIRLRLEAGEREKQMEQMAYHDALTGLPNRLLLMDRLQQALSLAKRNKTHVALVFFDLDKFKPVNDQFGHDVGDLLLKEIAKRLRRGVRASDTISRVGGDEFIILLNSTKGKMESKQAAEHISKDISEPYELAGQTIHISACFGVAEYPEHGADAELLIKCADTAMYHAKKSGYKGVKFYRSDMVA